MKQLSSTQPHDIKKRLLYNICWEQDLEVSTKKHVQPGRFVKLSSKLFWVRRLSNQA
jgi:hypothetical protein